MELTLTQQKSEQAGNKTNCMQHRTESQAISMRFLLHITSILTVIPREQDLLRKILQGGKISEHKDTCKFLTSTYCWIFGSLDLWVMSEYQIIWGMIRYNNRRKGQWNCL